IASSTSVDPARRKRAADEIEAMQRPAVNVTDLPSDDMTIEQKAPSTPEAPPRTAATATATPAPVVTPHAAPTKAVPVKTAAPAPHPAVAPKPDKSTTLVRKNPFDE
ncbi:MAG TPA: hypothetical protein VGQ57_14630, partial [Polyangiaceae bacterium]|nr:hypothetical protein [Polyangiaceae bacterium]